MDTIARQLLLQAFLIFLNAFFAMTEIAVISLSPARLRKSAAEGDKTAAKLLRLSEQPAGFLSTIQIGITLAGFLGSAFAADSFSDPLVRWLYEDVGFTALSLGTLDTLAVILITLILSYFTLVLGELVPKRIAMQKPMEVARMACGTVSFTAAVMKPAVWFLSFSTNSILRLLRLKTEAEEETVTEDEIRMMVDLGEEKGTINREEKEWIENVFEFSDASVHDCMTHAADVQGIPDDASDDEIVRIIRESGLSRFPVFGANLHDVKGILNAREFLLSRPAALQSLLRPAYFVPETMRASVLLRDMQLKKVHLAVAVDEYGETSGVVTMEDLLEEIVGSIYDEFDPSEPAPIEALENGVWRVSGSADVQELADVIGFSLPQDREYDTLAGLVFSCLRSIPQDGAAFDVETLGLHIHVERVRARRIESATVQLAASPGSNEAEGV